METIRFGQVEVDVIEGKGVTECALMDALIDVIHGLEGGGFITMLQGEELICRLASKLGMPFRTD